MEETEKQKHMKKLRRIVEEKGGYKYVGGSTNIHPTKIQKFYT